jgi:fatty-acid peroxygenase
MTIPRDRTLDATWELFFSEGYEYITNRCRQFDTDIFSTRLMLRSAVCMQGAEAAEQFYHPGRFTRRRALPLSVLTLIQDLGSVIVLDKEDHDRRKAMFLSLMSPESLTRMAELTEQHWRAAMRDWQKRKEVILFHEAHVPICAAICEWAGLKLSNRQIGKHAREMEAMVEGTGAMGPRNWKGHWMRARSERWMRRTVRRIRRGRLAVPEGSAAAVISTFRDRNGKLLDVKAAGVELLNVIRPAVATARYVVFAAMALDEHPEWRDRLMQSGEDLDHFADEVRRFYPFIPAIGGRVLEEFTWREHRFRKGDWVLMDLYGTNHDPRVWGDPGNFRPDRFRNHPAGPYDLVSHGAGDRSVTHRCPGEWITVEIIKAAVRVLVRESTYTVPRQDLSIDLARIPALPKSGFIIQDVALHAATADGALSRAA